MKNSMRFQKDFPLLLLLFLSWTAKAQFQPTGSNPASVNWHRIETENFKLIYPTGSDSLASVYGLALEKYRTPLARTSGFLIGANDKNPMPVILHGHAAISNGSVTWAPRRIDMFTMPDPYSPTPLPWPTMLSVHEGRHASQMQFGRARGFNFFHYLFGEMFTGALAGIYPGRTLLEGDAVTTETALSRSGRGRQANFMNYLMPAFDCGDWRNYWKWSYGSQKYYAPDFYRTGYLLVSGTRVFFNDPQFMERYFDRVTRNGWFNNLQKTVKSASGLSFKASFRLIEENYQEIWDSEAASREPFMPSEQLTRTPWRHTAYNNGILAGGTDLFVLKNGISEPTRLIRLSPNGKEKRIRPFSVNTGYLYYNAPLNRIYWTETVPAPRWDLQSHSVVRYIDVAKPRKIHNLTRHGKHFTPALSPDGKHLSVTEYPVSGGSRLDILNAENGRTEQAWIAPDSLQFVESAWAGNRHFVSGISENGFGIYEITGRDADGKAKLRKWLGPQPVSIDNLSFEKGCIAFISDRTGVEEYYFLNLQTGALQQLSSTRYGLQNPCFNAAGDTLYYTAVAASDRPETYRQGSMLYKTALADLPVKVADFNETHPWKVADILSAQEAKFHAAPQDKALVSAPQKYSKIRLPRFHSWAPVYFNYDNVSALTGDSFYQGGSIGATGIFQNDLGTGFGFIGYSLHKDPFEKNKWRHSGHLKYTYTGFFPVLEIQADFNDFESHDYQLVHTNDKKRHLFHHERTMRSTPGLFLKFTTYVPLNFSSGGLSRGLVPRLSYRLSSNRFIDGIVMKFKDSDGKDLPELTKVEGSGKTAPFQSLNMSLRGYLLRAKAPSQVFPSLGFGAELGLHTFPGHMESYPGIAYLYLYGYLPGLGWNQGMKLTTSLQSGILFKAGAVIGPYFEKNALSTVPRGFVNSTLSPMMEMCGAARLRATFDYAIPLLPLGWSFLSPAAYLKNAVLTPFVDYSRIIWNGHRPLGLNPYLLSSSDIFSFGADFTVNLGNFLWLPFTTNVGIRYAFNLVDNLPLIGVVKLQQHYAGFLFTVDL